MSEYDPVPAQVRREVDRIRDRWRTLPLGRAEQVAPALAALVRELGARSARALGRGDDGPQDLPIAQLADALTVVVHDCCATGTDEGLGERLAEARRGIG